MAKWPVSFALIKIVSWSYVVIYCDLNSLIHLQGELIIFLGVLWWKN